MTYKEALAKALALTEDVVKTQVDVAMCEEAQIKARVALAQVDSDCDEAFDRQHEVAIATKKAWADVQEAALLEATQRW